MWVCVCVCHCGRHACSGTPTNTSAAVCSVFARIPSHTGMVLLNKPLREADANSWPGIIAPGTELLTHITHGRTRSEETTLAKF